jgi:hypothetical protein
MNLFVGVGIINDVCVRGKILRFNLVIEEKKLCNVPCLLFDPSVEGKDFVEKLQTTKQIVWLQGKIASYDLENHGRTITQIDVVTYPSGIKPV